VDRPVIEPIQTRPGIANKRNVPEIKNTWNLSPMEFAVIQRTSEGLTIEQVAESLSLSPKTVTTYSTRGRQKMAALEGLPDRADGERASVSMARACVLLDRFMREGVAPTFRLMVEASEGRVTTRVME
jgi:DNA-binding CsgD family transcriptional regulator